MVDRVLRLDLLERGGVGLRVADEAVVLVGPDSGKSIHTEACSVVEGGESRSRLLTALACVEVMDRGLDFDIDGTPRPHARQVELEFPGRLPSPASGGTRRTPSLSFSGPA